MRMWRPPLVEWSVSARPPASRSHCRQRSTWRGGGAGGGGGGGRRGPPGFPSPWPPAGSAPAPRHGAVAGAVEVQREKAGSAVPIDRHRRGLVGQFPGQCSGAVVVAVQARVPQAHRAARSQ
ncbi:hypothetical protein [Nocardia abscessus]|uniref:hypothetical protein n=1 Tax=Nocardia abscessus TaxID=120957 RepID=UPI002454FDBA|nr:hypothetical protein [Nocardia abscessus]